VCAVETVGYIGRLLSRNHTDELGPYIIQSILILIAPALFAASIYMTLGRTIRSVQAEHLSLIRVDWLTRLFVLGDVFAFFVQAGGGGLEADRTFSQQSAKDIILAGLIIQILMFGLFWSTAVMFHVRLSRRPTPASTSTTTTTYTSAGKTGGGMPKWRRNVLMMYGTCFLIMVRSIFRVIEYAMGQHGYPLEHEWTLYVFDATLMFLTTVLFGVLYPGKMEMAPSSHDQWDRVESPPATSATDTEALRCQPMGVSEGPK
jgi:hypothetical protein